jgi:hypothetical protein
VSTTLNKQPRAEKGAQFLSLAETILSSSATVDAAARPNVVVVTPDVDDEVPLLP